MAANHLIHFLELLTGKKIRAFEVFEILPGGEILKSFKAL